MKELILVVDIVGWIIERIITIIWTGIKYIVVGIAIVIAFQIDPVYVTTGCPQNVPCVINHNNGGYAFLFLWAALTAKRNKRLLVINGDCLSACTILADNARPYVQITQKARFWFHQGTSPLNGKKSNLGAPLYSADILQWIHQNGGLPEAGWLEMSNDKARKFWPVHIPIPMRKPE
jgi:hypothetical protein